MPQVLTAPCRVTKSLRKMVWWPRQTWLPSSPKGDAGLHPRLRACWEGTSMPVSPWDLGTPSVGGGRESGWGEGDWIFYRPWNDSSQPDLSGSGENKETWAFLHTVESVVKAFIPALVSFPGSLPSSAACSNPRFFPQMYYPRWTPSTLNLSLPSVSLSLDRLYNLS